MYPNLKAELARRGLTVRKFAAQLGFDYAAFNSRIRNGGLRLSEAKTIRNALDPKLDFEYLFYQESDNG